MKIGKLTCASAARPVPLVPCSNWTVLLEPFRTDSASSWRTCKSHLGHDLCWAAASARLSHDFRAVLCYCIVQVLLFCRCKISGAASQELALILKRPDNTKPNKFALQKLLCMSLNLETAMQRVLEGQPAQLHEQLKLWMFEIHESFTYTLFDFNSSCRTSSLTSP